MLLHSLSSVVRIGCVAVATGRLPLRKEFLNRVSGISSQESETFEVFRHGSMAVAQPN
jgi:hypothetical protein